MSIRDPLGYIDIFQLLEDTDGSVSFALYDSGTCRRGEGMYGHSTPENGIFAIWPIDHPDNKLVVRRRVALKPQTIAFLGLYLGDGAKAARPGSPGVISFSQREPHLANFVRAQFIEMFGESLTFTHRVNEDALFFMTDKMRSTLDELRKIMLKEGKDVIGEEEFREYLKRNLSSVISEQSSTMRRALEKYARKSSLVRHRQYLIEFFANRPLMNEYLRKLKAEELRASGTPLGARDRIAVNVRLPGVKGSREEGKSSRSDELDVNGLSPFRSIFLRILSDVTESIEENKQYVYVRDSSKPWISWEGPPHTFGRCGIPASRYVGETASCCYFSGAKRYSVLQKVESVALRKGKFTFEVPKTILFTPLICMFFGLYLAEGQTAKTRIFKFYEERVGPLNVGFTTSRSSSLNICMMAMKKLFFGEQGIPEYWRIKVGSKYFPETITVGNKVGSPALRRGEKGQGAASGFEIVEALKRWMVVTIPSLKEVEDRFDHLEYTGAGIPRVDIFYHKGSEVYLFSLMRNLIVDPSELDSLAVQPNVESTIQGGV